MVDAVNDLTLAEADEEASILALQGRITVETGALGEQITALRAQLLNDPGNQVAIEAIVDKMHATRQRIDATLSAPGPVAP